MSYLKFILFPSLLLCLRWTLNTVVDLSVYCHYRRRRRHLRHRTTSTLSCSKEIEWKKREEKQKELKMRKKKLQTDVPSGPMRYCKISLCFVRRGSCLCLERCVISRHIHIIVHAQRTQIQSKRRQDTLLLFSRCIACARHWNERTNGMVTRILTYIQCQSKNHLFNVRSLTHTHHTHAHLNWIADCPKGDRNMHGRKRRRFGTTEKSQWCVYCKALDGRALRPELGVPSFPNNSNGNGNA